MLVLCASGLIHGLISKRGWGYGMKRDAYGVERFSRYANIGSDSIQFKLQMVAYAAVSFLSLLGLMGVLEK